MTQPCFPAAAMRLALDECLAEVQEPKFSYVPPSHARALDPDTMLVEGIRGSGKSHWWQVLGNDQQRHYLASVFPETRITDNLIVSQAFGLGVSVTDSPSKDTLAKLLTEFTDPRPIWRTVIAVQLGFAAPFPDTASTWHDRVNWVAQHPEDYDRLLATTDQQLAEQEQIHLILFDALDRMADDWITIRPLARALFQLALDMRSCRAIRLKLFVRVDMLNDPGMFTFPDASKLLARKVSLSWRRVDLYAMLFQALGNAQTQGELFRAQCLSLFEQNWEQDQQSGVWKIPQAMRHNDALQRQIFHALTGAWMGNSSKRGAPYSWLPNHLLDGLDQVSPRSFLAALRKAVQLTQNQHTDWPWAIHYRSLQAGVQAASEIRVDELCREDYPWIKTCIEPLRGLISVPCATVEITSLWQANNTIQQLKSASADDSIKLPPSQLDDGETGLLNNLIELGVMQQLQDTRIQMPDVYRLAFGLGRRGGVKALGNTLPANPFPTEIYAQRLAENRRNQYSSLDLSGCNLLRLPEEIEEHTWLKDLYLHNNSELCDLGVLRNLSNLQFVNCSGTQVNDLSPLAALTNLQNIECLETQVSDLSPLADLTHLKIINCSKTLVRDLSPLAALSHLNTIHCSATLVSDLSPLAGLTNLECISCASTQVSDLSPLTVLTNLKHIDCSATQIKDLSPLASLTNLQSIFCSGTQVSDLSPLASLTNLQSIFCTETQINDLTPILPLIIRGLSVCWRDVHLFNIIRITNCPLICPPIEIAQDSPAAVLDYFTELGTDSQKLNEVKIIFLGEASAGKTSLVKRLMNQEFDAEENQTHGIRIRKLPFTLPDGDTVTAHLWDFGGQEVMHATHQFFLSQRSIYVLLLNSRNDDQAEKWLKHAESFGGQSPVLVVLNKIDENPSFEVEQKTLRDKYPQIQGFYRLSCKEDEHPGLLDFKTRLTSEIAQSTARRTPFPASWLKVKNHFTDMREDFIQSAEYRRAANDCGVTSKLSQNVLLQFLHDLGVLINFRNLQIFDTQILNPLWLTNGVYRIINSKLLADHGGILKEAEFEPIINDPRYINQDCSEKQFIYPTDKLLFIVRIMQEFELCFPLPDDSFVVPQLLPVNGPDFVAEGALLQFVINFPDFLPNSLFTRLMVKLHEYIRDHEYWRTGMVLCKPTVFAALAQVRWDKEDRKIIVEICGEDRRRLLSFIRATIKEIIADFHNLNFEELVPVPNCNDTMEYDYLVTAENAGETEVFIKALKKKIPIATLLDGVEEAVMRDEDQQLPVNAFVSYSHRDLDLKQAMRSALAPLMRLNKLQLWDDQQIDAGTEWREEIFRQLAAADIVLCLVSPDFVASDFCYTDEFKTAYAAHLKSEKIIVPIRLRCTDWDELDIAKLQGFPVEWIGSADDQDAAWTEVSKALRPVLEKARQRKLAERKKKG